MSAEVSEWQKYGKHHRDRIKHTPEYKARKAAEDRRYRAKNRDRLIAKSKTYYEQNKERLYAVTSAYKRTDKAKNRARERKLERRYKDGPSSRLYVMLRNVKSRAKKRNQEFDETHMRAIASNPPIECASCLKVFDYAAPPKGRCHADLPSYDRVNSELGYTDGNVRIICFRCNSLKKDATVEELRNVLKYMEENLK